MAGGSGAIAFSMLLGITLIVSVFATGIALLAFFEGMIDAVHMHANDALLAAHAGAHDALRRIALNRNFESVAGYSVPVGAGAATVVVERVAWGGPSQHTRISSTGRVQDQWRRIQVVVYVNAATGATRVVSWREVTI